MLNKHQLKMNTITLPDELAINSALSLKIYNYKTTEEISKQQVLLNKNTFSFLQEETKKVFFDKIGGQTDTAGVSEEKS